MWEERYDVIVVGGGHSGCEAAAAAARLGMETLMITMDLDRVAQMACNPAIGGLGKGHLVREIDALGGLMGKVIDQTGIHFKMLGQSRGPAVHGPRAQADKKAYQFYMKYLLEQIPNLHMRQDRVEEVVVEKEEITGVRGSSGCTYHCKAVILTTGTFLNGKIHVGLNNYKGGRAAEPGSFGISKELARLGFELSRLKTGTPPRIHARTIDFSKCEAQAADEVPQPFSYSTKSIDIEQVPCYITYTNEKTHEIIRNNLDRSPMYSGVIQCVGPRYCPSIEDKIVKFPDRNKHQIFLEPEGRDTLEIYANGISTSLPQDVQLDYVHSIVGLENARIMRFGYAVEYDFVPPTQIYASLETKKISGLFLAGQINGTTGYEEAAAQGLIAGINAAGKIKGREPFTLGRDEAYIGVLVDDLVTRGTSEPYRMFTSRAEYRLLLRQDNADRRLMPKAYELGMIDKEQHDHLVDKENKIAQLTELLAKTREGMTPLEKILKRPEVNWEKLCEMRPDLKVWNDEPTVAQQVEIALKYDGYLRRQEVQVKKLRNLENVKVPSGIDYTAITGLRLEAREKLKAHQPESLGQASRISGVSPADISVLMVHFKKEELSKG